MKKPVVVKVPFEKLRTIYHLADIHVRLVKRHAEYKDCFQNLYEELVQSDLENAVIVVAGDIVHAKCDMSPEMISLTSDFLRSLAELAPTIVFAGNHDKNLSNANRLDAITPIVDNLRLPNLHYFKNSGVYKVADVDFGLFSISGDKAKWPSADSLSSKTKIALFHGPVNNATTDIGYVITNRHVMPSLFTGYDMVLLGDIHKHQTLQEYNSKVGQPIIVYPGSLIQQSHGENLDGHGYCVWDVEKRTFEFKELRNAYGFCTLNVVGGKLQETLDNVPDNPRVRLFVKDTETSTIKKISALLRKRFNVQELTVNRIASSSSSSRIRQGVMNEFSDIKDVSHQNELIKSYLKDRFPAMDENTLQRINEINAHLNSKVKDEDMSRNIHWRPLYFKFSNMFSYGEDNEIDFENMTGTYGLFAPNTAGKTAALDSFMFTLFDKTPRAFKASHIMNNQKNTFECYLRFEIEGATFGIKRTGTRNKKGDVKVDVDFWKEDGRRTISLNGEDRRGTNANIRAYIGDYEDFLLTNISAQNNGALFVDKSQSERKDLLGQFMGINILDKLYTLALDEMKEVTGALKRFNRNDFTEQLAVTQTNIELQREIFTTVESSLSTKSSALTKLEKKAKKLYGERIPLDVPETNLQKLTDRFQKLQIDVKQIDEQVVSARQKLDSTKDNISKIEAEISSLEELSLDKLVKEFNSYTNKEVKLKNELKVIEVTIQNKEAKLVHLKEYEYDPNCKFCVNNIFVKDAKQTEKEIEKDREKRNSITENLQEVERELDTRKDVPTQHKTLLVCRAALERAKTEELRTQSAIEGLIGDKAVKSAKINEVELGIQKYNESIDLIEKNKELDAQISLVEQERDRVLEEIKKLDTQLRKVHGELEVLKAAKADMLKSIKDAEELEDTFVAYEYYIEAVNRDGIPSDLIKRIIPTIEAEINNILGQIVEFTIVLEAEGKNINGKLVYDFDRTWPLELSSGMERFISSLAIRVALVNISNLPKPNFLVVDEGLGTLDADNLASMTMMFSILKAQFDFIIIVSHIEATRDIVDNLIEIKREKGFSQIRVT